ncbi:copper resistance system multicopper oxidase [Sphingomonas sp. MMS24-J13]|uniref:copper resistance system multicopper oxidase n=1 Tax=Sphingomonas sp. MMS24-J13 TaxID=3238686 RepID=UPI00384D8B9F
MIDHTPLPSLSLSRRRLLQGVAGAACFPASAWAAMNYDGHVGAMSETLSGSEIALAIDHSLISLDGGPGHAITVNGGSPGPTLRLREGKNVRIHVTNRLDEQSSIHWHGVLLPFQQDGVPGVSFPGIAPGATFTYDFPIVQAGTYWYHGHSGMQEAMGLYGAIVIDPAEPEPQPCDRDYVLLLSDWSFLHPHELLLRLKQEAGYFNRQAQTVTGLIAGKDQPLRDRLDWGRMRMDPTDIADVAGATYRYLINGRTTSGNWTGLFAPGERVRLRIINASAMTNFNVRIPGLAMTVIEADGQPIVPVETDEFQIGIAETYDVIVSPTDAKAYGVIAEAIDRSGLCRATLAPHMGMTATVPPRRQRPLLTMRDMGMGGMVMGNAAGELDLSKPAPDPKAGMGHHSMNMRDPAAAPDLRLNPGIDMISAAPVDRTGDRPTGLEDVDHRVLTYRDLRSIAPNPDRRTPTRAIALHLTGNMDRYMWSFDGVKFSDGATPIAFTHGERVRVTLINDTMMPHPIHLHGHFFELVTSEEDDTQKPHKHTVNVLPGGKVTFDLTAAALGDWAFHCHMLLHMHAGMFRVVTVREATA